LRTRQGGAQSQPRSSLAPTAVSSTLCSQFSSPLQSVVSRRAKHQKRQPGRHGRLLCTDMLCVRVGYLGNTCRLRMIICQKFGRTTRRTAMGRRQVFDSCDCRTNTYLELADFGGPGEHLATEPRLSKHATHDSKRRTTQGQRHNHKPCSCG
jgi:hypothetical protein